MAQCEQAADSSFADRQAGEAPRNFADSARQADESGARKTWGSESNPSVSVTSSSARSTTPVIFNKNLAKSVEKSVKKEESQRKNSKTRTGREPKRLRSESVPNVEFGNQLLTDLPHLRQRSRTVSPIRVRYGMPRDDWVIVTYTCTQSENSIIERRR